MSAEARQHPRACAKIRVEFQCGNAVGVGYTSDVSQSGMFLETDTLAPVGARIYLRLGVADEEEDTETFHALVGVVRRVEPHGEAGSGRGMGIRFEVASTRVRESLVGFIGEALSHPETAQLRLSEGPSPPAARTPASSPDVGSSGGGTSTWLWALGIGMVLAAVLRLVL